jgi:hypothetical protein
MLRSHVTGPQQGVPKPGVGVQVPPLWQQYSAGRLPRLQTLPPLRLHCRRCRRVIAAVSTGRAASRPDPESMAPRTVRVCRRERPAPSSRAKPSKRCSSKAKLLGGGLSPEQGKRPVDATYYHRVPSPSLSAIRGRQPNTRPSGVQSAAVSGQPGSRFAPPTMATSSAAGIIVSEMDPAAATGERGQQSPVAATPGTPAARSTASRWPVCST